MLIRHPSWLLIPLFAAGCEAASTSSAELDETETVDAPLSGASFVDAPSYLTAPTDIDAWYQVTSTLKSDFDNVCGDTFCEGDYSNYQSLGFRCSVNEQTGAIGKCVWILAASTDEVVPATGNIKVHGKTWRCVMPLKPHTPMHDFLQALTAPGGQPIHAKLPGTDTSLYDGLGDCL